MYICDRISLNSSQYEKCSLAQKFQGKSTHVLCLINCFPKNLAVNEIMYMVE
jgi:hypothetical protein